MLTFKEHKINGRTIETGSEQHYKNTAVDFLLVQLPLQAKALSELYGKDKWRNEISKFKSENFKVLSLLQ